MESERTDVKQTNAVTVDQPPAVTGYVAAPPAATGYVAAPPAAPPAAEPTPESKPAKNPKRVAAGKKLVENNKKAKEKMLEDIAEARANAIKANTNAEETRNTLKSYLEQKSNNKQSPSEKQMSPLEKYQTHFIISGLLLIGGLYIWSANPTAFKGKPTPVPETKPTPMPEAKPSKPQPDDLYTI